MKKLRILCLMVFVGLSMGVGVVYSDEKTIALPPSSLAQWYKPTNERQVWLHNMFKLRRELQAVSEYLNTENHDLLDKWTGRFAQHYRKIGEMVPEWQDELELEWLKRLETSIQERDREGAGRAIKKLARSCKGCHQEYRAITALTYRVPSFSQLEVGGEQKIKYPDHMGQLSKLVNRIKIASEDQRKDAAAKALSELRTGLRQLEPTCETCHADTEPKERILGAGTQDAMDRLAQHIENSDVKQTGRTLGEVAVVACARCHGVHRTAASVKALLVTR